MSYRTCIFLTIFASAKTALAAGPNIELAIMNNQVVTTHCFAGANPDYLLSGATYSGENYNPLYSEQSVRMINVPLVQNTSGGQTFGLSDNGWYGQMLNDGSANFTGPGIAFGANADLDGNPVSSGFSPGYYIGEYLVGSLQVWNGHSFSVSTTDRLEGISGPLDDADSQACFSTPVGSETGSWEVIPSAITPDGQAQIEWRLDPTTSESADSDPADGIYLMKLQAWTAQKDNGISVQASLPFYFLFDKNDDADLVFADAYVQGTLLPEPGVLAGVAGIWFMWRRRR